MTTARTDDRDQGSASDPKGVLATAERALLRALRRPRTRESLRVLLRGLDPENARAVVRTALWTEPELFLSLLGSLPRAANAAIYAADELLAQLAEKLSPDLRRELVGSLLADVDHAALARVIGRARALHGELAPLLDETWRSVQAAIDREEPSDD